MKLTAKVHVTLGQNCVHRTYGIIQSYCNRCIIQLLGPDLTGVPLLTEKKILKQRGKIAFLRKGTSETA